MPALLKAAYMHVFQVLYIEPLSIGPKYMQDLFIQNLHTPQLDGTVVTESAIDWMVDGLESFLEDVVTAPPDSPLIYPQSDAAHGGGAITLLTKIFENALIEMADDEDDAVKGSTACLHQCVEKYQTRLETALQMLVKETEADHHRQLLSNFVAAINLSSAFDPKREVLAPGTALKKSVDKMRAEMTSGHITEEDCIDTFGKFARVAKAVFWSSSRCFLVVKTAIY